MEGTISPVRREAYSPWMGLRPCCSGCCSGSPPGGASSPSCPRWAVGSISCGRDGKPSARSALARQYTVQALESEEDLTVTDVQWTQLEGSRGHLQVYLEWQGEPLSVSLDITG